MTLRPGRAADAAPMARILRDWKDASPWMPDLHTPEEDHDFCAFLLDGQDVTVLCLPDVQGFLSRDGQEVTALYLAPGVRGQGHGRALLDLAKAQAARLTLWTFQANTGAISFYQRAGFAELRRTPGEGNEEQLPDVQMIWVGGA